MPAKKRSSTRRVGSTPKPVDTRKYISDIGTPDSDRPALPDVPTKQSFAYGSPAAPVLPRELSEKREMDLAEMAKNIDMGIEAAEIRERESSSDAEEEEEEEQNNRPRVATRSRKIRSISATQNRFLRDPTPDQAQLLDSLRESSPVRSNHYQRGRSSPTPQPPVPRTLSPISSSAVQSPPTAQRLIPESQIYPTPLARSGYGQPDQSPLGSSPRANSVDNQSIISWNLERDVHNDHLQRTQRHRKNAHGKNITAPPRRPSGLAFPQENIEEEESIAGSVPQVEQRPRSQDQSEPQPELQPEPQPAREPASALTRTIIPNTLSSRFLSRRSPSISTKPESHPIPEAYSTFRKLPVLRFLIVIFLMALSVFVVYFSGRAFSNISEKMTSHFPHGGEHSYTPLNASGMDAINALNSQMKRLTAQVTSLSKDMKFIKTEVDNVAAQKVDLKPVPVARTKPQINFLTVGAGAIIDPWRTSPASGKRLSFAQRNIYRMAGWFGLLKSQRRDPQPAMAALSPWEDIGDCWCSVPRDGAMSQLSVSLGRDIVPEEVVVEHIPEGAALNSGVAPREMEMWAKYKVVGLDGPEQKSSWFTSSEPRKDLADTITFGGQRTLSETIMDTLSLAYPNEPESNYADDRFLGPGFYRIGKWTYDRHGPDNIQSFPLDAIIDSPSIRVDHVIFRVKSNWGADNTCLYRLKLHGHV